MERRLYRSEEEGVIAGVCGGFGTYFGLDPVLVRLGWVLFTLLGGAGVLAYVLAWYIMPDEKGKRSSLPLLLLFVFFVFPSFCCGCSMFFSFLG